MLSMNYNDPYDFKYNSFDIICLLIFYSNLNGLVPRNVFELILVTYTVFPV